MLAKGLRMVSVPKELIGATERRYLFKELLQARPNLGCVWLATFEPPCLLSYSTVSELTNLQIRTRQICLEGHP